MFGACNNGCLAHANLLQLVGHHGNDSVTQWEIWACFVAIRYFQPVEVMVVNGTRSVFLTSVVPVTFEPIWPRPGNNVFTDRHQAAAWCWRSQR